MTADSGCRQKQWFLALPEKTNEGFSLFLTRFVFLVPDFFGIREERSNDLKDSQNTDIRNMIYSKTGGKIMCEKRCYSVKEVQEILGVGRATVYKLLKKNEFRCILIAGKYLILKDSFDRWLNGPGEAESLSPECS